MIPKETADRLYKLFEEIEALGGTDISRHTFFAGVDFDSDRISEKKAAEDILMCMSIKKHMTEGKSYEAAFKAYNTEWLDKNYKKITKKPDIAAKQTDAIINNFEKKVSKVYKQAYEELVQKTNEYFAKTAKKDAELKLKLKAGEITKEEYIDWRRRHIAVGKQWTSYRDTLANDLVNADKIAAKMINEYTPDVYALNFNYATYDIEHSLGIDTSFNLYNKNTVKMMLKDDPDLIHKKGDIDMYKDYKWNKKHINAALTQGILQGEGAREIAKRMQNVVGMDERSAMRMARTCMTAAQNQSRFDSYHRAEDYGLHVQKMWMATLDSRTRASHVELDGEIKELDEEFSNGLMYPAADGEAAEVVNCRCTMTKIFDKYKIDFTDLANRRHDKMEEATYEEWKAMHGKGGDR